MSIDECIPQRHSFWKPLCKSEVPTSTLSSKALPQGGHRGPDDAWPGHYTSTGSLRRAHVLVQDPEEPTEKFQVKGASDLKGNHACLDAYLNSLQYGSIYDLWNLGTVISANYPVSTEGGWHQLDLQIPIVSWSSSTVGGPIVANVMVPYSNNSRRVRKLKHASNDVGGSVGLYIAVMATVSKAGMRTGLLGYIAPHLA